MDKCLFRGKREDNGQWVYGNHIFDDVTGKHYILPLGNKIVSGEGSCLYGVIAKTVGLCTGLYDKNNNPVYAGDIVKGITYSSECCGVIVWIGEIASFGVRYRNRTTPTAWEKASILKRMSEGYKDEFTAEVVGNVYDNPELLEVENV
jgi:uncharacterized phage protein (TIGR01671 family)